MHIQNAIDILNCVNLIYNSSSKQSEILFRFLKCLIYFASNLFLFCKDIIFFFGQKRNMCVISKTTKICFLLLCILYIYVYLFDCCYISLLLCVAMTFSVRFVNQLIILYENTVSSRESSSIPRSRLIHYQTFFHATFPQLHYTYWNCSFNVIFSGS